LNDDKKAESSLLKGNSNLPNDFDMLFALADFYVKRNRLEEAKRYALELENKFPSNPAGKQIIDYISKNNK
jgi:predicted Zn-dependent protease